MLGEFGPETHKWYPPRSKAMIPIITGTTKRSKHLKWYCTRCWSSTYSSQGAISRIQPEHCIASLPSYVAWTGCVPILGSNGCGTTLDELSSKQYPYGSPKFGGKSEIALSSG